MLKKWCFDFELIDWIMLNLLTDWNWRSKKVPWLVQNVEVDLGMIQCLFQNYSGPILIF